MAAPSGQMQMGAHDVARSAEMLGRPEKVATMRYRRRQNRSGGGEVSEQERMATVIAVLGAMIWGLTFAVWHLYTRLDRIEKKLDEIGKGKG